MTLRIDRELVRALLGILGILVASSIAGALLARAASRPGRETLRATVANINARIRAWWVMSAIFGISLATGGIGSIVLFGALSFLALREFITLTPTRRADHRTLFWSFFAITPLQYSLLFVKWYGLFAIFIPVYAFLFVPIRIVLEGDTERFLERAAKIQWGLMVCVYCVSHAPALLMLRIPGYEGQNGKLLLFFVVVVQLCDVFQYIWGKLAGGPRIAPTVSPSKTWSGFLGGIGSATLLGAGLHWLTPFSAFQAAQVSLLITLLGFAGGLTMSAIKRDRGLKDFGSAIAGHGGILDRIDSICFAAPVLFHLTRFYFKA
ncbi:MAG: phosphatidate cytidylyltransferase [Acidobacteriota bacterium]